MTIDAEKARSIFIAAVEDRHPSEWDEFLDEACRQDVALRRCVERLLRAHKGEDSFLDRGDDEDEDQESILVAIAEMPGDTIGPYKLTEQIGEGGMGVVFLAEQQRPVCRKVALKIVKPGMDTREVIGRFEAERQALAMMDHPNIAKVFDAGTVGQAFQPAGRADEGASIGDRQAGKPAPLPGRPYFVMELVQGVPITEYCDECQLTTRDRLELFVTLCRAVQHAHQKGIIHRDIKPTNVLVAMQDGRPTPKIIDFGVAKAIGGRLTERTLTSGFAQMLGTPLYMSPEQADLSPLGVDTRSDVYSLGVLLYELLTGATPFDKDRLHTAPYDEVRRIIREEEPPRPSTRISTIAADTASTIADRRRTDTRRLVQSIRGELDWIMMKALDKDRNRRYESANDLARDVERHLADEPVHARQQSKTYRLGKFVQKNRASVAAAAAVLIALTVGVAFSAIGFARAVAERDQAQANLQLGRELIDGVLEPAATEMAWAPYVRSVHGMLVRKSVEFYEILDARSGGDPDVRAGLANALTRLNYLAYAEGGDAISPAERAIALLTPLVDEFPANSEYRKSLAFAYSRLAEALDQQFRFRTGVRAQARSLELLQQVVKEQPQDQVARRRLVDQYYSHGAALYGAGQLHLALKQRQAALQMAELADSEGGTDALVVKLHVGCAKVLLDLGRYEEASQHLAAATRLGKERIAASLEISERLRHELWFANTAQLNGLLRICLGQRDAHGELSAAIERLHRAVTGIKEIVWVHNALGQLAYTDGLALTADADEQEALAAYERAIAFWRCSGTATVLYDIAIAQWRIGELYHTQRRVIEGNEYLAAALREFNAITERLPGEPFAQDRLVVFLCMCPNPALRDYKRAVQLAEAVVNDSNGPLWRYLGLARYRAGDWAGAEEAIKKGMGLRNGGDALDWVLLAGIHHRAGDKVQARGAYEEASARIAADEPIYYGHIGVLGFQQFLGEIEGLLASSDETTVTAILQEKHE